MRSVAALWDSSSLQIGWITAVHVVRDEHVPEYSSITATERNRALSVPNEGVLSLFFFKLGS